MLVMELLTATLTMSLDAPARNLVKFMVGTIRRQTPNQLLVAAAAAHEQRAINAAHAGYANGERTRTPCSR